MGRRRRRRPRPPGHRLRPLGRHRRGLCPLRPPPRCPRRGLRLPRRSLGRPGRRLRLLRRPLRRPRHRSLPPPKSALVRRPRQPTPGIVRRSPAMTTCCRPPTRTRSSRCTAKRSSGSHLRSALRSTSGCAPNSRGTSSLARRSPTTWLARRRAPRWPGPGFCGGCLPGWEAHRVHPLHPLHPLAAGRRGYGPGCAEPRAVRWREVPSRGPGSPLAGCSRRSRAARS